MDLISQEISIKAKLLKGEGNTMSLGTIEEVLKNLSIDCRSQIEQEVKQNYSVELKMLLKDLVAERERLIEVSKRLKNIEQETAQKIFEEIEQSLLLNYRDYGFNTDLNGKQWQELKSKYGVKSKGVE